MPVLFVAFQLVYRASSLLNNMQGHLVAYAEENHCKLHAISSFFVDFPSMHLICVLNILEGGA